MSKMNQQRNLFVALLIISSMLAVLGQNCSSSSYLSVDPKLMASGSSKDIKLSLVEKPPFYFNLTSANFKLIASPETPASTLYFYRNSPESDWIQTAQSFQLSDLNEGKQSLQFKTIIDGIESEILNYSWVVDLNQPKVEVSSPPPPILGRSQFEIKFTTLDLTSEVSGVHCTLDDKVITPCNSLLNIENLSAGPHSVSISAIDSAGNSSLPVVLQFSVDTQSPWIEITQHPPLIHPSGDGEFVFSALNTALPFIKYECQLDEGNFTNCMSPFHFSGLSEGRHSLKIRGIHSSMETYPTADFSWTIDKTPPTLEVLNPLPQSMMNIDQLTFLFQGNDGVNGTGIKEYQCAIPPLYNFETCQSPKTYSRTQLRAGSTDFKVRAMDHAGLTSEISTINYTLRDWNVPFITLNLIGGAALAGNILPIDANKNKLMSYSKLGAGINPSFIREFGAFWIVGSQIYNGIKSKITNEDSSKIHVFAIANQSVSDTNTNKLDVSGLIEAAGLKGTYNKNIGTANTPTGIYHASAILSATQPLQITSSLQDFTSFLPSNSHPNPLEDPAVMSLWGLTSSTGNNSRDMIFAAATLNSLNHNTGAVGLSMAGFDYHNGTRTSGDALDLEAGKILGKIIKTALLKNEKVFIYLTTDGGIRSVDSELSSSPWIADSNQAAMQMFIMVDPSQTFEFRDYMIGAFTEGQIADPQSVAGTDTEKVAAIVACNYTMFNGQPSICPQLIGNKLTAQEIQATTILNPQMSIDTPAPSL